MPVYVVRQGDHLASIAHRLGVAPDAIWGMAENEALRVRRGDGSVLAPGDVLIVPDSPAPPVTSLRLGSANAFRVDVPMRRVSLRLRRAGQPVASAAYRLEAEGQRASGTTGSEGEIALDLRVSTRRARLFFDARGEVVDLDIAALDPVTEPSGAQARLAHLGLYRGPLDGVLSAATAAALRVFQGDHGLATTGELDEPTARALKEAYGC